MLREQRSLHRQSPTRTPMPITKKNALDGFYAVAPYPASPRLNCGIALIDRKCNRGQWERMLLSGRRRSRKQPRPPWTPLGPVPLASDGTGQGLQDYHQVSGRATAIAIDTADPSGNTVYIGGAQGGVWKSTNAAASIANNVTWTPVTDDQATLSIGSIAIQPGNTDPTKSVVLVGTGEADNSADSYFGLGILRSADGGNTWTLISTANSSNGTLPFSGLGATRMAFSTASGQTGTVVAIMAATAEGVTDGALTSNTYRGLYTSVDAGQTWTYDALFSGGAIEATSATSVVYNAAAGMFFAALRYHGFYSSPDGLTWTRLANQPGAAGVLSTTACPQNYSVNCPIYRGEITVVSGRNEMYTWFISLDSNNNPVDQGIWQSENGGASWAQINESGIITCGDADGCGAEQGYYNLELLAVPNGSVATHLYAGAINLFKCSINSSNPACSSSPFINLTHVYGCDPLSALAHVHPDQHALAYMILPSGNDLMYFANDGGIYRTLDGYSGLATGSCSGTNQFDDLNQNLGSMTQFVAFSQHASDDNTLLGGAQDNGSPATATAMTNSGWGNVLSGDGGYNAIDSSTGNWFASNPDFPPGGGNLNVQECSSGVNCNDTLFQAVVNSNDVGGDDGSFYFPYILDPQSATSMLIGTCRVWRGPRSGGGFTPLSLNFETFGTATCAGTEVNVVRALAAGGPTDANGSRVIYATTDGLGPNGAPSPSGGHVWVTTSAAAVSGTSSTFTDVTGNGPSGSINPNQFPISSVAIDSSDPTGNTAYVTVMGFTGGPGHVWQTTNAGSTWIDFTGSGANALPDSPANAVVVDLSAHIVYVGTDVGVFKSATSSAVWTEVGPVSGPVTTGFLPNVAVTALALFSAGGQKLLRASTYGRGVWQFNLLPDFRIAVSNPTLTVFAGQTAAFNGTLTSVNGYSNSVALSCMSGLSSAPSPCVPNPVSTTPTSSGIPFVVNAGPAAVADYSFNVQGSGSDPSNTTHDAALTLHVVSYGLTAPSPSLVNAPPGATTPPVSFQVTAQGSFSQSVTLSCGFSPPIFGASCSFFPSTVVTPTVAGPVSMTATVTIPGGTIAGNYSVTLQATTAGAPAPVTVSFTVGVTGSQDFSVSSSTVSQSVTAGQTTAPYNLTIAPLPSGTSFAGSVSLSCSGIPSGARCNFNPNPVVPGNSSAGSAMTIATSATVSPGTYPVVVKGTSGSISHSITVSLVVAQSFQLSVSQAFANGADAGSQQSAKVSLVSNFSGTVNASCDASALGGQCSVSPGNPTSIGAGTAVTLTLTVAIPNTAAPQPSNSYNVILTVSGSSGGPTQALPVPLTVIQDFSVSSLTLAGQTVSAGQTATYNIGVAPVGSVFASAVTLSCSGLPALSICSFAPNPVTPGGSAAAVVMTVTTGATTGAGTYALGLAGTSGALSHSNTASSLIVKDSFQLAISQPLSSNADPGSQQAAKASLTPNYTGSVTVSCNATVLAGQCSVTPANPVSITAGVATALALTVTIPNSAAPQPPNSYNVNLTVTDSSGQPSIPLTLPLTVIQDFNVGSLTPSTQSITPGQSANYNFSVLPVGALFNGAVTFSCAGAPEPLCSFVPSSLTPGTSSAAVVMTIATTSSSARLSPLGPDSNRIFYALWLTFPGICLAGWRARNRSKLGLTGSLTMLFLLGLLLTSCGGGGSNGGSGGGGGGGGGGQQQGTQPGTYTVTVAATSGAVSHQAASVTLIVTQ